MSPQILFNVFKEAFKDWKEDRAPRLGAALAYYTVFSLAPLLIIVIAVAGIFFGEEAARGQVVAQISGLVGQQSGEAIQEAIKNASQPQDSLVATLIGIVTLIFGASGVFGQLQDALNTIWEVQPKPNQGILAMIRKRFLSFTMVLGIGFLLLVSLVISAGLAGVGKFMGSLLPGPEFILQLLNFALSFGVITLLFAMIFKFLPDAKIAWRDVWIGAALTALLFTLGKYVLGLYIGQNSTASSYGAAGALLIILLWAYYSAQILFFGAEFTQVYANRYGSRVVPDKDAIAVTEEARAQQGMLRPEAAAQKAAEAERGGAPGPAGAHPRPQVVAVPVSARRFETYWAVRVLLSLVGLAGLVTGMVLSRQPEE